MATKTFDELKQMAIQIRDEKTNKQNTATRIGTQMLEHLNKLEQEYYDKTTLDKRVTELNISELFPTEGIDGSNEYTLAGAIAKVDSKYRNIVGLKICFVDNASSKVLTYVYQGGTFTDTTKWAEGTGGSGSNAGTKADVGSVFGAQKVEADGTSRMLEFTNFKSGLTLHIVGLKISSNSYVSLYGYENGAWKIIQQNVSVGITINKDLELPQEVDNYPKIGFGTNGSLLTGGYGYILTEVPIEKAIENIEKVTLIETETNKLNNYIKNGILINSANITLVKKSNYYIKTDGTYSTYPYGKAYDYTDISQLKDRLFLFKNLYSSASGESVSVAFYDIDKQPIEINLAPVKNEYYDVVLLAPDNSAYFAINRLSPDTLEKDVEVYTVNDSSLQTQISQLQEKTQSYETNALVNLPLYKKLNGNMVNPELWGEPQGLGKWTYSNLIPVVPGKIYYFGGHNYYEAYNETQNKVLKNTGLTSGQPFPENVYFVKFALQNLSDRAKIKVWLSETDEGYQKFGYTFNDLIIDLQLDKLLLQTMSMYFPHAGKKGLYVGDSYVVLGIPQGSAEYLKLASYESNGMNGQLLSNFIQGMVDSDEHINQIKNCDICFVEGGTNDFGHGGLLIGKYYDEDNTDKHLKFELQIFRKTNTEELSYNSIFKDGSFTGSGTINITLSTEQEFNGVSKSVSYSSGDTVDTLIDKIVALTFEGYSISKEKNSIFIERIQEGMHVWGIQDKPDYRMSYSVDFSEANEVIGYIKMVQNGSGFNETYGLSPYQLLANNNSPNSFSQPNICGAIKSTVETIHFFKPEVLVCFISQPERDKYGRDVIIPPLSRSASDLFNMSEISIRMEDTCKRLGIPFVDGHSIGCTMWSLDVYEYDKLHLKAHGKEILCRLIAKTLNMY